MIPVLTALLVVGAILLVNEWWWRDKIHGEISRKFVHITVGSFVAFWPLFLTWTQIELLSLAFVLVIIASQKLHVFQAIHSVQRPTVGEILFGVAVGTVAYATHDPAVYTVALLHMSLADGMAAVIGVKYGTPQAYSIFGMRKSIAGTLTFLIISVALLTAYVMHTGESMWLIVPPLALAATLLENLAVFGLDNLLIPLLIALVLDQIH